MGMFDGILDNLDDLAAKIGLPTDQVKALADTLGAKVADGGDYMSALAATASEHGLSVDKLKDMMAHAGGEDGVMGKVTGFLDKDGDGNALNDITGFAKGLFGKS